MKTRRTKNIGGMGRNIQPNKEALQTTKEAAPVREKRQPGVNTYASFTFLMTAQNETHANTIIKSKGQLLIKK